MPGRLLALGTAALILAVGCGGEAPAQSSRVASGAAASSAAPSAATPGVDAAASSDARALVAAALAARDAADRPGFVDGLRQAAAACADPVASARLDEVALIAARWAAAAEDNRPKVQARTEQQLTAVPWDELAAACSPS